MPAHRSDNDPLDESRQITGIGPWVEHARVVLDGLTVLSHKFEKLQAAVPDLIKEAIRESIAPLKEEVTEAKNQAKAAADKLLFNDGRKQGRAEITGHNEQRVSLWVVAVVTLLASVFGAIVTVVGEAVIHSGK